MLPKKTFFSLSIVDEHCLKENNWNYFSLAGVLKFYFQKKRRKNVFFYHNPFLATANNRENTNLLEVNPWSECKNKITPVSSCQRFSKVFNLRKLVSQRLACTLFLAFSKVLRGFLSLFPHFFVKLTSFLWREGTW